MTALQRGRASRPLSSLTEIRTPYKVEEQKYYAKLVSRTSSKNAPKGYTFLPFGTQPLADRCKKLSKERARRVFIVNYEPSHKHAQDPEKLSHHVHRIGYYFPSEILDQACDELSYRFHNGKFVTEEDLQEQAREIRKAEIARKHGVEIAKSVNYDEVRKRIKELFPKIPDQEAEDVITWGWKEGTGRVGTNETLDLSERVQLATIAKIRHTHTDYDYLLSSKVFEYHDARGETEKYILQKVKEWMGDETEGDDEELVEMIQQTILIDDDDGPGGAINGSEADDEESGEVGSSSEASIRITHEVASGDDLRAESVGERRGAFQLYQSQSQQHESRKGASTQKFDAMKAAIPLQSSDDESNIAFPGKASYRRPMIGHGPPSAYASSTNLSFGQPSPFDMNRQLQNHAIRSIERPDTYYSAPEHRSQYSGHNGAPSVSTSERSNKRRRLDPSPTLTQPSQAELIDLTSPGPDDSRSVISSVTENIQPATTIYVDGIPYVREAGPPRYDMPHERSPLYQGTRHEYQATPHQQASVYAAPQYTVPFHASPVYRPSEHPAQYQLRSDTQASAHPAPYDPTQPLLQLPEPGYQRATYPNVPRPANAQYLPDQVPIYEPPHPQDNVYAPQDMHRLVPATPYQPVYYEQPQQRFAFVPAPAPQPVHGAPAPIQQVPRHPNDIDSPHRPRSQHRHQAFQRQPTVPPPPPPADGAPHPAQYRPR